MLNLKPEQTAREKIDKKLIEAGWIIQNKDKINFNAGLGIVVREYQTDIGPADYILFIDRKPIGVIEAKREEEGHRLTIHEAQAEQYAQSELKWFKDKELLCYVYESTGIITRFTDFRDPKPRSRPVFSFHQPETYREWLKEEKSLRNRLQELPELPPEGLRNCQISAINNLEVSFKKSRPRSLIQMATGSGKTYTSITFVYRLLKFANAKRILFLVDTKNLGEQAEQEFMGYIPQDDNRLFTELYNVQRLRSSYVAKDSQVCISTIQRMYSILKGEELDESDEEENPNERISTREPMPVVYNPQIPIEFFDFVIIDECHRSIYNLWKQVLDYFDCFMIGLTATPDKRTFGFFDENVVSEYTSEQAVADGVNVSHEIYTIETKITNEGAKIEAKEFVDVRERLSRRKRWQQVDEEIDYSGQQLDRDIVNPSQIRKVIRTFRDKLPEIFPNRQEVPKTLIFAKNDSHAEDIVQTVRTEFDEGNEFCKKLTYQADDPKSILASFRNDYYPRIAVTVDMVATGTDVKPLECLLFMRDVKSRSYFEQMKGRGTRTMDMEALRLRSPSVNSAKTHFVIIDAVGVTKSVKTDSRPLERKRTVPLKDLLYGVMMGAKDEDSFLSLAGRLARLDKQVTEKEREEFKNKASGKSINHIVNELINAHQPDHIEEKARDIFQLDEAKTPTTEQLEQAQDHLLKQAANIFTGDLNTYIENVRKIHEQIIDIVNIDELQRAGWAEQVQDQAIQMIDEFKQFLESNKDEIAALRIFYHQPYQHREVTFRMIREVLEVLKANKPALAPLCVWQAYKQIDKAQGKSPKTELTALVSLIRHITGIDPELMSFELTVNKNFQEWVFGKQAGPLKFTTEQMEWLRMIRDHICTSIHIVREDLDYTPFDAKGGVGRMHQLFGDEMDNILEEMNEALVA
jgi:type I restriction enzyme R subunit